MSNLNAYEWWQTGVVYQIYPRSFYDTAGNGVGDLQGIIEKIDYLAWLGVDAVWISPFYPSPMADHGYDVADYCGVDPLFGDIDTFDRLLTAAHQRGIKVIIDYVPNHTSDRHPWFIESRRSRSNPKRDWYIWRDPAPDGGPPNNWGSFFGGPAWTLDETTGQYYLHQFVPGQPELNWRNPAVEEAMFDVLRYWLDKGVDGFRMDVIHLIMKDEQLRDNPPHPEAAPELPANDIFGRQLSLYTEDQDDIHPVLQRMRAVIDEYEERVIIGEVWGEWDRWIRYYGESGDEIHLPFNFRMMHKPWQAAEMRRIVERMEEVLPDHAWPNYVLGSHDISRFATRFGGRPQARTAALMLLTLRGTPTWYYGDEIGMMDVPIPREKWQDPQGINLGRTRDVARTPMQWTAGPQAGFTTADEPWLPIAEDADVYNVEAQKNDPKSMLILIRALLAVRGGSPALQAGRYATLPVAHDDCYVYERIFDDDRLIIALNFTDKPLTINVADGTAGPVLSTHLDKAGGTVDLSALELRPHEGLILRPS